MDKRKEQVGSAHVIVIFVLIIALLGALGFVFYQNFIKEQSNSKTDDHSVVKTDQTKVYSDDSFSFNYPSDGWAIMSGIDEVGGPGSGDRYISMTTDILVDGGSYTGPTTGANISIHDTTSQYSGNTWSWQEGLESSEKKGVITNLTHPTVDGQTAYQYDFHYEFKPYFDTVFEKDGHIYHVKLTAANGDFAPYKTVYNNVIESLKIK